MTTAAAVAGVLGLGVGWWRATRAAAECQRAAQRARAERLAGERFLARLAHDLRSPLSVVTLALDGAADDARSIDLARAVVRDMDAVLERCLVAARLAEAPLPLERAPVAVDRILVEIVADHPAGDRVVLEGDAIAVTSDARALQIVLSNLIENALAYGAADRPVVVRWRRREDGADAALEVVVVNAVGRFGPPDPARAFDRGYRGERSAAVTGAGLGLYLAQAFATRLGARVGLATSDGEVRAELVLPC